MGKNALKVAEKLILLHPVHLRRPPLFFGVDLHLFFCCRRTQTQSDLSEWVHQPAAVIIPQLRAVSLAAEVGACRPDGLRGRATVHLRVGGAVRHGRTIIVFDMVDGGDDPPPLKVFVCVGVHHQQPRLITTFLYEGHHLCVPHALDVHTVYLHQPVLRSEPCVVRRRSWVQRADVLSRSGSFAVQVESVTCLRPDQVAQSGGELRRVDFGPQLRLRLGLGEMFSWGQRLLLRRL